MNKKTLSRIYLGKNPRISQILRVMQLTMIALLVGIFTSGAESAFVQDVKVSVNHNSITLGKLLSEIEEKTDYLFFYSSGIDVNRGVTIHADNKSVADILNDVLKGTNISYKQEGTHIILSTAAPTASRASAPVPQNRVTVTGTVSDQEGILSGAMVTEQGTTNGVITDAGGRYSLNVAPDATLVVSFAGYLEQQVPLNNRTVVDILMQEDVKALEEVVVIGYGTVRRADVTTAVSTVSAENLRNRAAVSFGEAMAGQVAGVQIQMPSGAPGADVTVRVRGTGSINNSREPLFVVDGYPMEGGAFRLLNSSDIESIQILKDASSTAIYGSRGANGVVIVTTKKGTVGKPTVALNAFIGFQQREKTVDMMNRDQYVDWLIDGRNQAWLDVPVISSDPDQSPHKTTDPNSRRSLYSSASTQYMIPDGTGGYKYNFLDPSSVAQMPDNDWQDLLFRNALMQQYELSVSGGTENTRYTFSGSYINQEGIVIGSGYNRFNFRTNVQTKINKRLNVGMSLMAYHAVTKDLMANGKDAPVMYALNLPPIYPVRNDDGSWGSMVRNPEILAGDVANPLAMAENIDVKRKRHGWMGTIFAELEIIKDLKFRTSINGGIQDNIRTRYQPSDVDRDASKAPRPAESEKSHAADHDWVIENTLNYNFTLRDKHSFNLLAGYTTQAHSAEDFSGQMRDFPNDNIHTMNAGASMYNLTSTESEYSMISYLGRINYVYDDRYLLTATLRSDGSSRFGANNKWGTFPSASVGWRVSQEKFMQNARWLSDLKLRAGWGISGNNRIGNYASIGLLSIGLYPTGDAVQSVVSPNTMSNLDLGWERVRQWNLGFELGVLDNRIRLEADFYDSQSIDLLMSVQVPTITGYSSQVQNVGKVQNRGMEFTLNTRNFVGEFTWSSNFNISFNKNKVLQLGPDGRPIFASAANANNSFITMIGEPIANFWGYKYMGVFMSQEELDKYPHLPNDKVGDGRYLDVDNNGVLDSNDKTIIGNNQPDFIFGFSNAFSYKNFSLNIQLTGSYGAEVFSFYKRMCGIYHGDRNAIVDQVNRWRSPEEPGDGIHFRATRTPAGWQRDPSSAWVQDVSYLRLRNLTFGYDFNGKAVEKIGMRSLRLYVTGQNLFTLTKYEGYDPENSSESGLSQGGDYMGYPAARSFIVGANITF